MLDLKFIKDHPDAVRRAIQVKNVRLNLDDLLQCEQVVAECKRKMEGLQAERNANAKKVSQAKAEERESLISRGKEIGQEIEVLKTSLVDTEQRLKEYLLLVPNIPSKDAPIGKNEEENIEIRRWGTPR